MGILKTAVMAVAALTLAPIAQSSPLLVNGALLPTADPGGNHRANLLQIQHSAATAESGNRISLLLAGSTGDLLLSTQFEANGLPASPVLQSDLGNSATLSIQGSGNLVAASLRGNDNAFSALQNGIGNSINADISGSGNQAFIAQFNSGNYTSVNQSGMGNSVSVQQTSW